MSFAADRNVRRNPTHPRRRLAPLRHVLTAVAGVLCLGTVTPHASAAEPIRTPITRFFDGAAREIVGSLESGNGWAVVSDRRAIQVLDTPMDSVRYRMVTRFEKGTTSNDQFYVQLELGDETPYIYTVFRTPIASGPSLTLAKKANEAIAEIDATIKTIEAANAAELNAEVRAFGEKLLKLNREQRAALVDVIQKDVRAIESTVGN